MSGGDKDKPHWGDDPFSIKGAETYSTSVDKSDDDLIVFDELGGNNGTQNPQRFQSNGGNDSPMDTDDEFEALSQGHPPRQQSSGSMPIKLYSNLGENLPSKPFTPSRPSAFFSNKTPTSYASVAGQNSGSYGGGSANTKYSAQQTFPVGSTHRVGEISPTSPVSSTFATRFPQSGGGSGVRYESESSDEDEPPSTTSSSYAKRFPTSSAPKIPPRPNYGQYSASSSQPNFLASMDQLSSLGAWEEVPSDDKLHKILTAYVKNSSDFPPNVVQIHNIMRKAVPESVNTSSTQTLLWFKTTPESVKYLKVDMPGCISFYDRVARALSVRPSDITTSHRQIILLCSVTLGRVSESDQGYRYWSHQLSPLGFDCVKANGRLIPNLDGNQLDGYTIIPCGKTVTVNKSTRLDYNEYIVFGSGRVSVSYAIDIEIKP